MSFVENAFRYTSVLVLIAANLVPLFGVYFFGWNTGEILLLYWSESAIIGFYTVAKMVVAKLPPKQVKLYAGSENASMAANALKFFYIPFFIVHYGGFMLGHLVFIMVLFAPSFSLGFLAGMAVGFASLLVSHGVSFVTNYLEKKEYEKTSIDRLMFSPYPRIIAMHLTIIFGAFINAPLVILIAGKTAIDLWSHLEERKKYAR
jgi:hypothetical protein